MLSISQLFIYPIKSLGGIEVLSADLEERGFKYDRRWMLIDEHNRFISQRENANMALLQTSVAEEGIRVFHKNRKSESILIPYTNNNKELITVSIWDDQCNAQVADNHINQWFSHILQITCRLVYMPEESQRLVEKEYGVSGDEITSFADAYPVLIISQASLDYLNSKLDDPISMNRFRPNIVVAGAKPFEEDELEIFTINSIKFFGVKLCARCPIPTINQENALMGKEPNRTLAGFRVKNNKIYFGMNLLHQGKGTLHINDPLVVLKRKEATFTLSS